MENTKRDVADIIDAVIAEMPESVVDATIKHIQKEAHSGFVPPECRMNILGAFTDKFCQIVPKPPVEDWHFRAVAKLLNTTVDRVKGMYT